MPPSSPLETDDRNWAGNYRYSAARRHHPRSLEQVRELVSSAESLKALGSRHSFNPIADTRADQLSLGFLNRVLELDPERRTVTVEGGIRYGELCRYLDREGYALPNLASLPHISIAGACATATHGAGERNGNLATAVSALELVDARGALMGLRQGELDGAFEGAVVGLGALGVVTKLTLNIVPAFMVRQWVYEELAHTELEAHFDEIQARGYSVSLFTDWRSPWINQVWVKQLVREPHSEEPPTPLFSAKLATTHLHPIKVMSAANCTEQLGIPGPWHERLPHFRMDHTPSSGDELQSEYFVPRRHGVEALRRISALASELAPLLQISEVRTIAADRLWMSPCYHQPSVAIHFTWRPVWAAVRELLPKLEERLDELEVRPHWGKLFTMEPAKVAARYERLQDFRALVSRYDPHGKFRNDFVDRYVFGR